MRLVPVFLLIAALFVSFDSKADVILSCDAEGHCKQIIVGDGSDYGVEIGDA